MHDDDEDLIHAVKQMQKEFDLRRVDAPCAAASTAKRCVPVSPPKKTTLVGGTNRKRGRVVFDDDIDEDATITDVDEVDEVENVGKADKKRVTRPDGDTTSDADSDKTWSFVVGDASLSKGPVSTVRSVGSTSVHTELSMTGSSSSFLSMSETTTSKGNTVTPVLRSLQNPIVELKVQTKRRTRINTPSEPCCVQTRASVKSKKENRSRRLGITKRGGGKVVCPGHVPRKVVSASRRRQK
jgi:hypothetical protein